MISERGNVEFQTTASKDSVVQFDGRTDLRGGLIVLQVLRFYGFFKEQVDERVEENTRFRKCTIYFYLADGMIHIGVLVSFPVP